jgi:hypothetical protein
MNKKKVWNLIAVPGLAATSLLLAFLLLGWNTVGAASDGPAAITDIQSLDTGFIISGTMFATDGAASGSSLGVCSDVWITETVDSEGDVGQSTSLVLAPTYPYTPQISYHDVTSDNLKYAWLSGTTWLSETVGSGGGETSLALVPTYPYTPCIAYYDQEGWALKYACRNSITWTIMGVDGLRAGQHSTSLALEPTYPYTPHICYYVPWDTIATLFHAYLSGTVWMSGTWVLEQVEPILSEAGRWCSLALESTYPYIPHISYQDNANRDLKYARLSGTTWLTETVDSAGDVGWYTSLALDSRNNPRISHVDSTNRTVKYAWLSGTVWLSVTVGSRGEASPFRYGTGTSLELNQANAPYISYYYDINNYDLKLAHLSGTAWITQTVDSEGDVGRYNSLALDQVGCPHISYYDTTNGDLKYAYLPPKIYLPIIMKNPT